MGIRIAMVVGEASGDLLASHLVRAIKARCPQAHCFGVGGPRMQAEGFECQYDYERLAVNGFVDVLKRYRMLSQFRKHLTQGFLANPPDLFIGVDAPEFNLWVERQLKKAGIKAIHFVSPSIWAWRAGRMRTIAQSVDHMLCLFPFEAALYENAGVAHTYVGHPLADELPMDPDREGARLRLGVSGQASPVFALLPGSRQAEVQALAPLFIQTAIQLARHFPNARFLVPLVTAQTRECFETALHQAREAEKTAGRLPASLVESTSELASPSPPLVDEICNIPEAWPPIQLLFGHAIDAMTAADAVLVASGTATLEAALLKRPMVIAYRIGGFSYWILKKMTYLPWVGLPNILSQAFVVPEYLQDEAQPEALAQALIRWIENPESVQTLVRRFEDLHRLLKQDTAEKAVKAVFSYLPLAAVTNDHPEHPSALSSGA
jgi:lipid-A-disaccharide synthase